MLLEIVLVLKMIHKGSFLGLFSIKAPLLLSEGWLTRYHKEATVYIFALRIVLFTVLSHVTFQLPDTMSR